MFYRDLDRLEKQTISEDDPREERKLIPVDSCSQLDTGYTGRSNCEFEEYYKETEAKGLGE